MIYTSMEGLVKAVKLQFNFTDIDTYIENECIDANFLVNRDTNASFDGCLVILESHPIGCDFTGCIIITPNEHWLDSIYVKDCVIISDLYDIVSGDDDGLSEDVEFIGKESFFHQCRRSVVSNFFDCFDTLQYWGSQCKIQDSLYHVVELIQDCYRG